MPTPFSTSLTMRMAEKGHEKLDLADEIGCDLTTVENWCNDSHLPRKNAFKSKLQEYLNIDKNSFNVLISSSTIEASDPSDLTEYFGFYYLYQWLHEEGKIMRTALSIHQKSKKKYEFNEIVKFDRIRGEIRGKAQLDRPNIFLYGKGVKIREHELIILHLDADKYVEWYPGMVLGISTQTGIPVASSAAIKFLGGTRPTDFEPTTGNLSEFEFPDEVLQVLQTQVGKSPSKKIENRIRCDISPLQSGSQ